MWNDDTVKEFWDSNKASYAGEVNSKEIIRLSRKYIKGKVLDVGAGSGALIELVPHSVGIDISPKDSRIIKASISSLPFDNCSFDVVFACDILEHLSDDTLVKGMQEIRRVLKNNGILIINTPYYEDLNQELVYCPNCKANFHRWGHLQSFNSERIFSMIKLFSFGLVKYELLPLGFMAKYSLVRYFWRIFVHIGLIKASDIYLVLKKNADN